MHYQNGHPVTPGGGGVWCNIQLLYKPQLSLGGMRYTNKWRESLRFRVSLIQNRSC